jgi:putative endonuclease
MEKFFVYILYSASIDRFYIGQTMNVEIRLIEHHQHLKYVAYTNRADDWVIFYQIECQSRYQSLQIEKHIKIMKSRKYLNNLKNYPEISKKLLEKYQ